MPSYTILESQGPFPIPSHKMQSSSCPALPSHILLLVTDQLVPGLLFCGVDHLPHEEDILEAGGIYHHQEWPVESKVTYLVPGRKKDGKGTGGCCSLCANFIHIQGSLVENLREKSQVSQPLQMYSDDSRHSCAPQCVCVLELPPRRSVAL